MNEFKITSRNGEDESVTLEDGTGNTIEVISWSHEGVGYWTPKLKDGTWGYSCNQLELPCVAKQYFTRDEVIEHAKTLFPMFKLFVGLMPKLERNDV